MKIVFFGNNRAGAEVLGWLKGQGENVVGLVAHPPARRKYGEELLAEAGLEPERVFDGSKLRQKDVLGAIAALQPELGVSVYFGYILKPELLRLFPRGCINLHPAFLPYNRGAYPNVWSILEQTPAGATLHYIDENIDTGDIIAQTKVPVESIDTGATLYRKLEQACVDLFIANWAAIKQGSASRTPQPRGAGTFHRADDVAKIDEIELDRAYTARELINLLRARSFPPYRGAYFVEDGKKIYINIQFEREDSP